MSAIWGFSCKDHTDKDAINHTKRIQALTFWNQCYGSDGQDQITFESDSYEHSGAMGYQIEHLSDAIPCPENLLRSDHYLAVIDAILYNREEIAHIIDLSDWSDFSDEELLFQLWLKKGYEALASVNGDFAAAIYDENNNSWTLFRDHLGIRPLFYYIDDKQFAFSTDMRALTALPDVDLSLNETMFYQEAAGYNALSLCSTEFAHIFCVHPASQMTLTPAEGSFQLKTDIYWKLGQKKIRFKDPVTYQTELRRLITDSVQRRLDAVSGLIGAELSGGLDSGIIDILINRCHREAVYYSWSYAPEDLELHKDRDERQVILDICEQEHISCHYTDFPKMDDIQDLKDKFRKIDPPYMNTPHLSAGSKWIRSQGARVVFTGHGGDEGVSHRGNPYELWYQKEYIQYLKLVYEATKGRKLRIPRTFVYARRDLKYKKNYFLSEFKSARNGGKLLNKDFAERIAKTAPHPPLSFAYDPIAYTMQGGPQVRLNNIAFQGAENGVRYMVPFMDYRVFDYAVSIPRHQFCNVEGNRWVYRKAFDDIMPQSLRDVTYKDTPSMAGFQIPGMDYKTEFLKTKEEIIDFLDWDFWSQYLDRTAVEAISTTDTPDPDSLDYIENVGKMDLLYKCCMIQNTMMNSGKMCNGEKS